MDYATEEAAANLGHVIAIRGSVLDVRFPQQLPALNHELRIGSGGETIAEVASQLDPHTVRAIAINSCLLYTSPSPRD